MKTVYYIITKCLVIKKMDTFFENYIFFLLKNKENGEYKENT